MCVCVYTPSFFRALLWWRDFCNSRKLWVMTCRATQDGWVMVESSDKPWPTRRGNGKQHLYSCCENPMNMSSTKREKRYDTGRWTSPPTPDWKVSNMLLVKSREKLLIAPERMKWLEQSGNNVQLWMCLVVKVKSDAVKK